MHNQYLPLSLPEHDFSSLFQIGIESFISLIFDGQLSRLNAELRKNLKTGRV
jgi:hypothetical protein